MHLFSDIPTDLEDVDILCLQETWLMNIPAADGFEIAFNPAIKGTKGCPMSGLLTLVKLESGIRILTAKNISPYIQVVKIKLPIQQPKIENLLILLNVYWQHAVMQLDKFMELISETICDVKENEKEANILICGDLNINCLPDKIRNDRAHGKNTSDPVATMWLHEMKACNIKMLNGETPGDIPAHFTWQRNQQQSTIDYMFATESMKQEVACLNITEMKSSDHCMLEMYLNVAQPKKKAANSCKNLVVVPGRNRLRLNQTISILHLC
ncbi:exodeoxyribonuclease-like [Ambystoma mexicanum]|uniref:exodeoxyribonuclease-like n=1 Tax=Ambystoma mexicanum TaxID=8296 RepID=UPI0037E75CBE